MEFMLKRKNPPRKALGVVRKKPEPEVVSIDPLHTAKQTVENLNKIRQQIKPLDKEEKKLSNTIKLWGIGVYPGFTTAIEVLEQPGEGFDMEKFKAENPGMHAKYVIDKPKTIAKSVPLVKG
jgi:predicted RNase H-like nuclease (RuvC/YqgF family)